MFRSEPELDIFCLRPLFNEMCLFSKTSHVQNRTTKPQFTSRSDRISDRNFNICKVCGSDRNVMLIRMNRLFVVGRTKWIFSCEIRNLECVCVRRCRSERTAAHGGSCHLKPLVSWWIYLFKTTENTFFFIDWLIDWLNCLFISTAQYKYLRLYPPTLLSSQLPAVCVSD